MKKTRIWCLILSTLLLICMMPLYSLAAESDLPDTSVTAGCRTFEAQMPLYGQEKMLQTAQAAMLYEVTSDTMMYSWNPDVKIPPASLVKIMTCLLVLENCDVNEKVTVTQSAMNTISKTSATLKLLPGEQFTVDHLLYGLMVGSANDAAVVLAEHVAGSQDAFVVMMNQRSQEIGCKDTFYVNAHGLHDDRQVTTARDVARLVAVAIQSEQFMEYFGMTSFQLPATEQSEERKVETTNYMLTIGTPLYYDARVTGGRTGITTDSKRSIVATAKDGGLEYIAVVLAAEPTHNEDGIVKRFGNYEEAKELFSLGFDSHAICQVLYAGQNLGQFYVTNGTNAVAVGPVNSVTVTLPSKVKIEDLTVRYGNMSGALNAPVEAGQQLSTVEVWYGSVCVASSPVVALNSSRVDRGSPLQENRYGESSKVWVVILIILLIAVIAFGAFVIGRRMLRGVQNVKSNIRYRKRRSDRRRTK